MQGGGSGPDTATFLLRIKRPIGADQPSDRHDQPLAHGGAQQSTRSGRSRARLCVRPYAWLLAGPGNDKLPSEQGVASGFPGAIVDV